MSEKRLTKKEKKIYGILKEVKKNADCDKCFRYFAVKIAEVSK